jgi:hypothetical protein
MTDYTLNQAINEKNKDSVLEKLRYWAFKFCGKGRQENEASDTMSLAIDEIIKLSNQNLVYADEIERLRKALVPFAEAADTLDKEQWDDGSIEGSCAYITAKDCRDARDVLDAIEPHK